jgi:hypothetical protein
MTIEFGRAPGIGHMPRWADLARCSRLHDRPLAPLRALASLGRYRARLGPIGPVAGSSRPNRPWWTHVPNGLAAQISLISPDRLRRRVVRPNLTRGRGQDIGGGHGARSQGIVDGMGASPASVGVSGPASCPASARPDELPGEHDATVVT